MSSFKTMKDDIAFWTGFYEDDCRNKENDVYDYFTWASNKAYLDMNRTLTFSESDKNENDIATEREKWRNVGTEIIRKQFKEMNGNFDIWHKQTCDELISYYNEGNKLVERNTKNKTTLTYGQAQKWLNMTLKYLWLLNRVGQLCDNDAETIRKNEKNFHVPLDSYILRYVARQDKNKSNPFDEKVLDNGVNRKITFDSAWSKIKDYSAYIYYQETLRNNLKSFDYPLEWELVHWHKALKYYDRPALY